MNSLTISRNGYRSGNNINITLLTNGICVCVYIYIYIYFFFFKYEYRGECVQSALPLWGSQFTGTDVPSLKTDFAAFRNLSQYYSPWNSQEDCKDEMLSSLYSEHNTQCRANFRAAACTSANMCTKTETSSLQWSNLWETYDFIRFKPIYLHLNTRLLPITMAALSRVSTVFAPSNVWIVGSNLTQGMEVCVRLLCV
jgi:hypothetical protein